MMYNIWWQSINSGKLCLFKLGKFSGKWILCHLKYKFEGKCFTVHTFLLYVIAQSGVPPWSRVVCKRIDKDTKRDEKVFCFWHIVHEKSYDFVSVHDNIASKIG